MLALCLTQGLEHFGLEVDRLEAALMRTCHHLVNKGLERCLVVHALGHGPPEHVHVHLQLLVAMLPERARAHVLIGALEREAEQEAHCALGGVHCLGHGGHLAGEEAIHVCVDHGSAVLVLACARGVLLGRRRRARGHPRRASRCPAIGKEEVEGGQGAHGLTQDGVDEGGHSAGLGYLQPVAPCHARLQVRVHLAREERDALGVELLCSALELVHNVTHREGGRILAARKHDVA
mmetsp:Transcript_28627/g.77116  ORF Transcript_28627/g.77116 Transcript_28627/m.77116 type:complete len:235 (+) Transcript_28627:137-841(+)